MPQMLQNSLSKYSHGILKVSVVTNFHCLHCCLPLLQDSFFSLNPNYFPLMQIHPFLLSFQIINSILIVKICMIKNCPYSKRKRGEEQWFCGILPESHTFLYSHLHVFPLFPFCGLFLASQKAFMWEFTSQLEGRTLHSIWLCPL